MELCLQANFSSGKGYTMIRRHEGLFPFYAGRGLICIVGGDQRPAPRQMFLEKGSLTTNAKMLSCQLDGGCLLKVGCCLSSVFLKELSRGLDWGGS
eukprot:3427817-Amphidinium_carterae.1